MGAIQSIGTKIGTTIAKATNAKPAVKLGKKFEIDAEKALATATVTSIILKDGIGCAMYVGQSINNDKIPEKKRKFVAALDLTNGVLMIGAQIAMFFAMRKYSGKIFDKVFKKSFNPKTQSEAITRMRIEDPQKYKKNHYEKIFKDAKTSANDLFKFILDISAATIVGKRVIVPLIATPLAKKVEKKMDKHHTDDVKGQNATTKPQEDAKKADNDKPLEAGKKLDVVSSENTSTNLLNKFNK